MSGQVLALVKGTGSNGTTRKEKKAQKAEVEKQRILDEAAAIGRATTDQDRLTKERANKIRLEDELADKEEVQKKIVELLGEFDLDGVDDEYAKMFLDSLGLQDFGCSFPGCGEIAEHILPLSITVDKVLKAKGRTECPKPKNHGAQWLLAAELIRKPADLRGCVFCEKHKTGAQKALEEKYPQDDTRNHSLYPLGGFIFQLGRNRFRLLREDRKEVDEEILRLMVDIENLGNYIKSLEDKVAEKKKEEKILHDLV